LRPLSPPRAAVDDAVIRICSTGAVLALLLVALRARILFGYSDLREPARLFRGLSLGAYSDIAYTAGLTGAFVVARLLTRNLAWSRRLTVGLFAVAASLSLLLGFVNVKAIAELGHPVNYQWLYYSNFMRSLDSYTALAALLSWRWLGVVVAASLGLLLAAYLLFLAARRVLRAPGGRMLGTTAAGGLAAYLGLGWFWQQGAGMPTASVENPVVALVGSVLDADANPVLAKMPTRFGPDDFLTGGDRHAVGTRTPYTGHARQAGVRNVIVIVLESVGAEYIWGFGSADSGGTPVLDHYYRGSRRFTSFYAHQPSSTHSLVSLLLGVYSPLTFRVVTREHPDLALPSLSGELKRQGYRTAMISAGGIRFQSVDVFLAHRDFDLIADSRDGCEAPDRHPDACMFRDLLKWVEQDPREPFFALLWTVQNHWPYFDPGAPQGRGTAPVNRPARGSGDTNSVRLARYLRAIGETDRALGELLRGLEGRGLLDSTLVIVAGDHGEAFGQHGNAFHRLLWEEEVRIPMVLINSRLFRGETDTVLGGTVDIAPTVLDLLGHALPAEWQGRSLFDLGRPNRVYLFGPYSGLFALREGNRKFIYDPIANQDQLYDLSADPRESVNLAPGHPEAAREARERLAAWVQYVDRYYLRLGVSR
jgi:lipoteichoic acid synthase